MAHDACTGELAKRHVGDADLLAYIAAWCRVRTGDRNAVDDLGRLARDARPDLARAAQLDVVNLVADEELPTDALHHLDALGLGQPIVLDLLAGSYRALGSDGDAMVVAARLRVLSEASEAIRCERTLAWSWIDAVDLDDALAAAERGTGDCAVRARIARCMLEEADDSRRLAWCVPPDVADPDLADKLVVLHAYTVWGHDDHTLIAIAQQLAHRLQIVGAEELAVSALEQAVVHSACDEASATRVRDLAQDLLRAHSGRFDARLAPLAVMTQERCHAFKYNHRR